MGVEGYQINEALASALDLPVKSGLLVARVYRNSTADVAGLRGYSEVAILYNERILAGGDIITEIDSKPVNSQDDLNLILESKRPGDAVRLTYYRGRTKNQKSVELIEQPRRFR
jgi:S1-C subfamily serine protease